MAALVLFAPAAQAEEINLLCTAKRGDTCALYVDTGQKYLTYCKDEYEDGTATKSDGKQFVQIDDSSIRFGDQSTIHVLDRYTGALSIDMKCSGSNKTQLVCSTGAPSFRFDPISCAKLAKKF